MLVPFQAHSKIHDNQSEYFILNRSFISVLFGGYPKVQRLLLQIRFIFEILQDRLGFGSNQDQK